LDIEFYDFKEHIDSIEWISSLPKGFLSDKIDIRYNTVTITKIEDGYEVYVGPKDLNLALIAGMCIMLYLASNIF
jgi:hypothetical protein